VDRSEKVSLRLFLYGMLSACLMTVGFFVFIHAVLIDKGNNHALEKRYLKENDREKHLRNDRERSQEAASNRSFVKYGPGVWGKNSNKKKEEIMTVLSLNEQNKVSILPDWDRERTEK